MVFIATRLSGRTLGVLLGAGFLMMLCVSFLSYQRASHVEVVQAPVPVHIPRHASGPHEIAAGSSSATESLTTEQMWAHLTRSRIPLDAEEHTSGDVKQAVPKEQEKKKPTPQVRPDWVDNPPTRVGNVYREVVSSGPYKDVKECLRALDPMLREVVRQRVAQLTDGRYSPSLERMGLSLEFVLREICSPPEWVETAEASFGEVKYVHVLMEFNAAVDDQLRESYRNYVREFRIAEVGGIAGLGLGGLALLFGMLKIDTWTKGYYTKRLFFGVPAAIIGIVLLLTA